MSSVYAIAPSYSSAGGNIDPDYIGHYAINDCSGSPLIPATPQAEQKNHSTF
ncbi:MAG: hypothetical protein IGS49_15980 [Chlorogloeopsis fritschii C42_A2020_084]|uniref:hypothetical protein n=1 Tax=Chlorogloeopsis fritschii TaxID=1124 RepID=UPI001A099E66|nr:hypothetical protein [Chlorogloeopsis fritschii]MBF2006921.1 hypothetical protein [Chlorogloeopsis fritschii C42_A2020_084]